MSRKSPPKATTTSFKITLATFVIFLCSTVAGVVHYFESAKFEAAKSDYNSKLASINRKLVGGDYLNVTQFVIHRNAGTHAPANSTFYPDDFFYAPTLQTWTYKKTTDVEFFTSIYGDEGKNQTNDITRLAPIHLWTRGPLKPIGGHDVVKNLGPCIYMQRLPAAELSVQLNLQASKNSQPALFQGDVIGAMLAQTFSTLFATLPFASDTQVYLQNISKVSDVLYCQFMLTLRNVIVDGRTLDSYFVSFETIVISTRSNVYTLCIFTPSEEPMPRGPVPGEVTEWLGSFGVFAD